MSKPYVRPSLAEQFGLKPDPNKLEHEFHGGVRLTKVHTTGGHPVDTDQPGFPVYHRRIAHPWPLMALGIGAVLLVEGVVQLGVRGLTQLNVVMNVALPLGIAILTAGMFAFADGNTYLATLAMTLGGLIGSVGLVFLPWTGIQEAYIEAGIKAAGGNQQQGLLLGVVSLQHALGIAFFAAMIPVFLIFLASFKTSLPIANGAFLITVALILIGAQGLKYPQPTLLKAAGGINCVIGGILFYSAMAVLMQEEGVNVPVFALPRNDD